MNAVDDAPEDPAADRSEPDPLTPAVRPGDLAALEVTVLAAARQWSALAAVAHHAHDPARNEALERLAASATDLDAFTWLWTLVTARPGTTDWRALEKMPQEVTVPEALLAAAATEVSAVPSDNRTRNTARQVVLARQHPTTPGAINLARAVLGAEHGVVPEVREEAARILGASRDRAARASLLTAATGAPWPERGQLLAALQAPLRQEETTAVLAVIEEGRHQLSPNLSTPDAHWTTVRDLVAVLPADVQQALLSSGWPAQPGFAALLLPGPVMQSLDPGMLRKMLERAASGDLPTPVIDVVLEQLHPLPAPHAVDLAERAHQLLPSERTAPARQPYLQRARMYREEPSGQGRDRVRGPALAALARLALAEPPAPSEPVVAGSLGQDVALRDYAGALTPGEVSQLRVSSMIGGQRRRLGAVLGLRLTDGLFSWDMGADQQRAAAEAATADIITVLDALDDQGAAEVLNGLAATAPNPLPVQVLTHALSAGAASTTALVDAGRLEILEALTAPGTRWEPTRYLDVLEGGQDHLPPENIRHLLEHLHWPALERTGGLARLAAALSSYPDVLHEQVHARIEAYARAAPEASEQQVATLLAQALSTGAMQRHLDPDIDPDPALTIETLVDYRSTTLRDLAAQWLALAEPTTAVVDLAVRADTSSAVQPSRYAAARTALATVLCHRAQQVTGSVEGRIEALQLAQRADPANARASALEVLSSAPTPLARAAAHVIASTPAAGNEAQLTALIGVEEDGPTRNLLEQARRRVTSGTTGEALANAVELVGAQDSFSDLDPAVYLPDPRAHEAFRACVDQARTSATESPTSRLNAMINLADLLGEQAIAAYWLRAGTAKEKEKAEKLRAGAEDKEDIGFLTIQQNLVQRLGWLPYLAALRESRTAHPAPRGTTTPLELTDADAVSAMPLLRRVFEGWVQQMHTAAGQPLPPVTR